MLISFFLSNPVPFNGQNYQKQNWPRTSDQKNSFISYSYVLSIYKFVDVIKAVLELFQKLRLQIYASQNMAS